MELPDYCGYESILDRLHFRLCLLSYTPIEHPVSFLPTIDDPWYAIVHVIVRENFNIILPILEIYISDKKVAQEVEETVKRCCNELGVLWRAPPVGQKSPRKQRQIEKGASDGLCKEVEGGHG